MIDRENWWDPNMSQEHIDHILLFELFNNIDKSASPGSAINLSTMGSEEIDHFIDYGMLDEWDKPEIFNSPLTDIICKHTRIVNYKKGDIIIREGDYGNSAFFIASGKTAVILAPGLPDKQLGFVPEQRMGLMQAIRKLWSNPDYPEQRDLDFSSNSEAQVNPHLHLKNVSDVLNNYEYVELMSGDMFGEIAVLGRTPRTATVVAKMYCELLEIRWQGLNDLRQLSKSFRKKIDALYKKNSLLTHLYSSPLLTHLSKSAIQLIADDTLFKTYGEFEWQIEHKKNVQNNASSLLRNEPLIVAEGHQADTLYLIRSGFARVSYQYNNGYKVIQYLGQGDHFGLETIVYNWKNDQAIPIQTSLHAVGYADILQVPDYIVERMILTKMNDADIEHYLSSDFLQNFSTTADSNTIKELDFNEGVLDFMSDYRFVNGASTMLIDTDRCTRCDECVTACAVGHNNNPRFNRHGQRYDHFMVANACMHCYDPVCMIGCPTGAIQRNPSEGQIVITDDICIGCSTCANACPYENISMVEARDNLGLLIRDQETHKPILKATKCNLCIDQLAGPACERACPHDALKRMDILDLPKMIDWMNR